MSEQLKILDDLKWKPRPVGDELCIDLRSDVCSQDLRVEIVKWFKMLSFNFQLATNKHHDAFYKDKIYSDHMNNCVTCWIKHFFNLTEEDLK